MNADLSFEEFFAVPIAALWEAVTNPSALAEWLMPNDFAPRVGHRFTFLCEGYGRGRIDCEVLECTPPERVVFSWLATDTGLPMRVTIELRPRGSGTLLTLRHTGPTTPEDAASVKQGWPLKLANLAALVSGRTIINKEAPLR